MFRFMPCLPVAHLHDYIAQIQRCIYRCYRIVVSPYQYLTELVYHPPYYVFESDTANENDLRIHPGADLPRQPAVLWGDSAFCERKIPAYTNCEPG